MFNKKILVAAVLGLGALGLSSTALADSSQGVYVAAQGGWAQANYGNSIKDAAKSAGGSFSSSEGGFGGNLFVGYQFNSYYSVEAGYTYLPNNKYDTTDVFGDTLSVKEKTSAIDLLGKANLPLDQVSSALNGFNVFVKGGAAYETAKIDDVLNVSGLTYSGSATKHSWVPVAGLGASYNINSNIAADVSYMHFFGKTTNVNGNLHAPSANIATIGLSYLFG